MSVKRHHGQALANESCHLFQTFSCQSEGLATRDLHITNKNLLHWCLCPWARARKLTRMFFSSDYMGTIYLQKGTSRSLVIRHSSFPPTHKTMAAFPLPCAFRCPGDLRDSVLFRWNKPNCSLCINPFSVHSWLDMLCSCDTCNLSFSLGYAWRSSLTWIKRF